VDADIEDITEQLISNTRRFDAYNWLAATPEPTDSQLLGAIFAGDWDKPGVREYAIEHCCVGFSLAARFKVPFAVAYDAIAAEFKAAHGEGFWFNGFQHPAGSIERLTWEWQVRALMPRVIERLREVS
jgi:hypothetical protein